MSLFVIVDAAPDHSRAFPGFCPDTQVTVFSADNRMAALQRFEAHCKSYEPARNQHDLHGPAGKGFRLFAEGQSNRVRWGVNSLHAIPETK